MEPLDEGGSCDPFDRGLRHLLLPPAGSCIQPNRYPPALAAYSLFPQKESRTLDTHKASFFDYEDVSPIDPLVFEDENSPHTINLHMTGGLAAQHGQPSFLPLTEDFGAFAHSLPPPNKSTGRRVVTSEFMSTPRPTSSPPPTDSTDLSSATLDASSFPTTASRSRKRCYSNDVDAETSSFVSVSSTTSSAGSSLRDANGTPVQAFSAPPSLVHQACHLYAQTETVVNSAIRVDPAGVKRRLSACHGKKRSRNAYDYPINIALNNNASQPVIELLADAAPDVLMNKDGPDSACALSCALLHKRDLGIISFLLEANPDQVRAADRHKNFPLHTACANGASLPVVKLLASAFPNALRKKNFHGQTPLGVAQQRTCCHDDVIDYMQHTSFGTLEENAIHLDDLHM